MDKYKACRYDMLLMNCNHFADEFVRRLYSGKKGIPSYINRAAWYGSFFHCLVPLKYLTVIPEGCTEEQAAAYAKKWREEDELEEKKKKE